jgi:hypothetical protein
MEKFHRTLLALLALMVVTGLALYSSGNGSLGSDGMTGYVSKEVKQADDSGSAYELQKELRQLGFDRVREDGVAVR